MTTKELIKAYKDDATFSQHIIMLASHCTDDEEVGRLAQKALDAEEQFFQYLANLEDGQQ